MKPKISQRLEQAPTLSDCEIFGCFRRHNNSYSTATFGELEGGDIDYDDKLMPRYEKRFVPGEYIIQKKKKQVDIMDDINLRSNNLDEQIIKCFDKYLNEPIPDGGGVLPNKVLDKSLDLIYKHLINKE